MRPPGLPRPETRTTRPTRPVRPSAGRAVARPELGFSLLVGLFAGTLALGLTTTRLLAGLDWDNAAHYDGLFRMFGDIGGGCGHGTTAWTCGYTAHMALVPVYAVGAKIAMLAGGDIFVGMRLVNALSVAVAAAMLALLIRRLGGGALLGGVAVGAFLFTENVLHLIRTVEDDCLSLAWMAVILYLALRDPGRFNPAVALALGALLGGAALTNYPMVAWAPVVLAAAVLLARPGLPLLARERLVLPVLAVAGFGLTVAGYGAWLNLRDPAAWPLAGYWAVLGMEPNQLAGRPGSVGGLLEYVSGRSLATSVRGYPTDWLLAVPGRARLAGALLIAAATAGVAWPLRRGLTAVSLRDRAITLSSLALLAGTIPAAWKNDATYFERMSHVPLCLTVLLVAAAVPGAGRGRGLAAGRKPALAVATLLLVVGVYDALTLPTATSLAARFESLEQRHPGSDAFVFAESEFTPGDYEMLASLSIALPNPIVLTPTGDATAWAVRPFTVLSPDEYRRSPPDRPLISDAARALVTAP